MGEVVHPWLVIALVALELLFCGDTISMADDSKPNSERFSGVRLLIFDLDGTLIDSRLDLVHSVNATLHHVGRPSLAHELIESYVGNGVAVLLQRALGSDADPAELQRAQD